MKVYIYGAGNYGKRLYSFVTKNKLCEVEGFVQSEAAEPGRKVCGVSVFALSEIAPSDDNLFLLAIADRQAAETVRGNIFIRGEDTIDCAGFIGANLVSNEFDHRCILCGIRVKQFDPMCGAGVEGVKLFQEHHVIGGGQRENCICPNCGSIDRSRWVYYVLLKHTRIFAEKCSVLHFAPEGKIAEKIRNLERCSYITADIRTGWTDVAVDMTDIPFKSNTFDYVIANHVLEHIENEEQAVRELLRVTRDDGRVILSFPICTDMDTYEDPAIVSPDERLRKYGQEDHVRLYGKDFKERLEKYGMEIGVLSPKDVMDDEESERLGLINDDVVMICRKSE